MKSAKEFACWLHKHFKDTPDGVYLNREDITTLSNRQHFNQEFVTDINYELTLKGMGFVTGSHRDKFYLFHLPTIYWQEESDDYQRDELYNVHSITKKNAN